MAWQTPKTNWAAGDGVANGDLNRIEENIRMLSQSAGAFGTSTGSANAYSVTASPPLTALSEGACVAVKINVTNTAGSTINVNGLGAKAIKDSEGLDVPAGRLKAGSIYTLRYNGVNFTLEDGYCSKLLGSLIASLGSAAYTNSTAYATATQGTKADNAIPKSEKGAVGGVALYNTVNAHMAEKASLSINGHVQNGVYTTTLNTTWSGTSAPYSKTQSIAGILSTDTPIVDIVLSGVYSIDEARLEAWGQIYRITTANGSITLYAKEKPTISLPIQLKVVR